MQDDHPLAPGAATAADPTRAAARELLRALFQAALAASSPEGKFETRLPPRPSGRTIVLGAGKAAASMAAVFERAWSPDCGALVITRYGHGAPTGRIRVVEAAHPDPTTRA